MYVQCGVRHSTESALLKVLNDLLLVGDSGNCAILNLLDLSAGSDTINHDILRNSLKGKVDILGISPKGTT